MSENTEENEWQVSEGQRKRQDRSDRRRGEPLKVREERRDRSDGDQLFVGAGLPGMNSCFRHTEEHVLPSSV